MSTFGEEIADICIFNMFCIIYLIYCVVSRDKKKIELKFQNFFIWLVKVFANCKVGFFFQEITNDGTSSSLSLSLFQY